MFDFDKLNNISKTVISKYSAEQIYNELLVWADKYSPEYAKTLNANKDMMIALFGIDRGGDRPRKDIYAWSQVEDLYSYMYTDIDVILDEKFKNLNTKQFLLEYVDKYDINLDKQSWFAQIKEIALANNFADNKDYRANPTAYAGSIADACNIVRVAVTGRANTPDLCSIMQLLGEGVVKQRINNLTNSL